VSEDVQSGRSNNPLQEETKQNTTILKNDDVNSILDNKSEADAKTDLMMEEAC